MEFKFDPGTVLRKPISVFTAESLPQNPSLLERLIEIINELGIASAKAQGLRGPVTTTDKLQANPTHRVYIMTNEDAIEGDTHHKRETVGLGTAAVGGMLGTVVEDNGSQWKAEKRRIKVVGLLKVGIKHLFVVDEFGRQLQINPLCVLDFYVHEAYQRRGYGKRLFDYMLQIEIQRPGHLAYDRPSPRLIAFLKKHYGLAEYLPQPNHYVIYKDYGLGFLQPERTGHTPPLKSLAPPNHTHGTLSKNGNVDNPPPIMPGSWQVKDFRRKAPQQSRPASTIRDGFFGHRRQQRSRTNTGGSGSGISQGKLMSIAAGMMGGADLRSRFGSGYQAGLTAASTNNFINNLLGPVEATEDTPNNVRSPDSPAATRADSVNISTSSIVTPTTPTSPSSPHPTAPLTRLPPLPFPPIISPSAAPESKPQTPPKPHLPKLDPAGWGGYTAGRRPPGDRDSLAFKYGSLVGRLEASGVPSKPWAKPGAPRQSTLGF